MLSSFAASVNTILDLTNIYFTSGIALVVHIPFSVPNTFPNMGVLHSHSECLAAQWWNKYYPRKTVGMDGRHVNSCLCLFKTTWKVVMRHFRL